MLSYKRAITKHQSKRCEEAKEPVCVCRCGGRLHGKSHMKLAGLEGGLLQEQEEITQEEVDELIDFVLMEGENQGDV